MEFVATSDSQFASASNSRMDAQKLLNSLDELTRQLKPGAVLPTQLELMRQYNASERSVRWALDELRRQGKVASRRGTGTVITDRNLSEATDADPSTGLGRNASAAIAIDNRTIVAVANPEQSVFDRALQLLFRQVELNNLSLVCRPFKAASGIVLPEEKPLGYMLFGRELIPQANQLQTDGQRVVLVGTPYADSAPGVPCVYSEQEYGGYLATRHLLDLGHRRIAYRGPQDWSNMRRWRGHQQALAEARRQGVEVHESFIFDDEYEQWRRAPQLATAYFRTPEAPTAVVAWNDQAAMSLLSLLSYVGVCVPQDVSLIGYDDLPAAQLVHPPLTTIDIALDLQIRAALRMLKQPHPLSPAQEVIITSTLVQRESTADAPRAARPQ